MLKTIAVLLALSGVGYAAETYVLRKDLSLILVSSKDCVPCMLLKAELKSIGIVPGEGVGIPVESYPTVILCQTKDGQTVEVGRFSGYKTKDELIILLALKRKE